MKSKKKLFAFGASVLLSLSLASCVTTKDGVVIEFKSDGVKEGIKASELYDTYKLTSAGVSAYYNAIYSIVLRHEMKQPENANKYNELVKKAKTQVDGVKDDANDNAETNKTNYDDELDSLLESNGAKDLDQLQTIFEDALIKEYLEDKFYDDNMETLLKNGGELKVGETTVTTVDSYLHDVMPYHVKHILVKTSAGAGNYSTSTITKGEAEKLSSVIVRLANLDNETFGQIAKTAPSDDSGSAENYGDLGIMSKNTSYVNEFKLGIYNYDSLFNANDEVDETYAKALGLTDEDSEISSFKDDLYETGINEIPYGAVLALGEVADLTKDDNGEKVNNGAERYYPRNIYWNYYFNMHNISFITSDSIDDNGAVVHDGEYKGLAGFKDIEFKINKNGDKVTKNVLCDENGNPILVTRAGNGSSDSSYQGIHFIVIQRNPLVADKEGELSLADYYTTYLPSQENFPKDSDGNPARCYVNYLNDDTQTYLSRSESLKTEIKSADPTIATKIYQYYFAKSGAKITDEKLATKIDQYIEAKELKNLSDEEKEFYDTWKSYVQMLGVQANNQARKIPTTCALKFHDAYDSAFEKGGVCYYEKA